jgi:hypothetical protein
VPNHDAMIINGAIRSVLRCVQVYSVGISGGQWASSRCVLSVPPEGTHFTCRMSPQAVTMQTEVAIAGLHRQSPRRFA